MKYLLQLPLPPSLNSYYGHHCKHNYATVYIKTKGKEYRKTVLDYIIKNNLQLRANVALTLNIVINPSSNRIWDLDNRLKATLDALTEAEVWNDDSLIYKMTIEKGEKTKEGGIMMEISAYNS